MFAALAYLVVFYAYPLARILALSVSGPHLTLDNFAHALTVPVYTQVLWRSFRVASLATAGCILLGYPVAYLLAHLRTHHALLVMPAVLLPFWISVLVRSYAWMAILGREGVLSKLLQAAGLVRHPVDLLNSQPAVLIGMVHVLLPFFILPAYTMMLRIDDSLLRAAAVMGAAPHRVFLRIFLPLSLPGVIGGGLLVFIQALGFYITPQLLGGPGDTMIAVLIDIQVSQLLNWGLAAALATMLLVATLAGFLALTRVIPVSALWGRGR